MSGSTSDTQSTAAAGYYKPVYRPEEEFAAPPVTLTGTPPGAQAGEAVTLSATLRNTTRIVLRQTVLYLAVAGVGQPFGLGNLAPGATATRSWRTTLPAGAEGPLALFGHAVFDVHAQGADCTRATTVLQLPYRALSGAFANVAIASDDAPAGADIDGSGSSLSAQALAGVGLSPGASVTYDAVAFTWPDVPVGRPDNVIASGQGVRLSGSGSRLAFLATSTWGDSTGAGTVVYADGTRQAFSVTVPDWYGANPAAAVVLPYRHVAAGRDDSPVSLFVVDVPLRAGQELQSVLLPNVSAGVQAGAASLHVFAMTVA
jgi:hypothetical protein